MTGKGKEVAKRPERDAFLAPVADARSLAEMVTMSEDHLARASGRRLDHDRVARLAVLTRIAAQKNPDLLKCTKESLFFAFLDAARSGLEWDGELGALVPYWNNKIGGHEARFQPMYRGLVQLVAEAGILRDIRAVPVYRDDVFEVVEGTKPEIRHVVAWGGARDDADMVAVYAVATLRDGSTHFDVMSRAEVDKRRAVSKAKSGPWDHWFVEMARKTIAKRLLKYIPKKSAALTAALDVDTRAEIGASSLSEDEQPAALPRSQSRGLGAVRAALDMAETEAPAEVSEEDEEAARVKAEWAASGETQET